MKAGRFVLPFILAIAAICAYANSFSGVFLFDDIIRIVEEERIRRLWPVGPLLAGERPMVDLSLAVNYAVGGLNPFGFHAFNLAVHILAGLTLFGIIERTVKFKVQSSKIGDQPFDDSIDNRQSIIDNSWASFIAFVIALIFLIHPLQTQSVTYVIQRGESMMGFFYLLTLYCAIRAIDSSRKWSWYLAAVIACALGMGTKAVMVTAPLIVILYDLVFLWRNDVQRNRLPLYVGLCSTLVVLWLCGIGPEVFGKSTGPSHVGFSYQGISAWQYASTQPGVILKYIQLALWPANLCLDYDWPVAVSWQQIVLPAILVVSLLIASLWLLYRRHWLGFLGAWFFLVLAPTSSFIPIKDLMFEHRMYLPLAALITAIIVPFGLWLNQSIANSIANRKPRIEIILIAIILVLVAPLAYAAHLRNRAYHSELTMWQDVVEKRPNNARAHVALGNALAFHNELLPALEAMRQATMMQPEFADGHCAVGIILSKLGRTEEAIASYQNAVKWDPAHSRAWYNLGNALDRMGHYNEAIETYSKSIKFNPRFANAYTNLGNTLMRQNQVDAAIEKFQQAIAIDPKHAKAHNNLGDALLTIDRLNEAQAEFEQAIRIDPQYHKARLNLALLLRRRGEYEEAMAQCQAVLEIDPTNAGAQELLIAIELEMKR